MVDDPAILTRPLEDWGEFSLEDGNATTSNLKRGRKVRSVVAAHGKGKVKLQLWSGSKSGRGTT